jgi:signal transduction histidine kinase
MHIASLSWVAFAVPTGLLFGGLGLAWFRRRRYTAFRLVEEHYRRAQAEMALQAALARVGMLSAGQDQVRSEERSRIARDIHDDLGQNLLALKIELSMLQLGAGAAQPGLRHKLSTMGEHLDGAIASLRCVINDLRPAALGDGLHAAVVRQLEEFTRLSHITYSLDATPDAFEGRLDTDPMVFRILQEALSNIARHAQATDVAVSLLRQHDQLQLKISDNGIGLPASASPHGCGLHGMRERVATIGGQFDVYSRPGAGTLIKLSIPLPVTAPQH